KRAVMIRRRGRDEPRLGVPRLTIGRAALSKGRRDWRGTSMTSDSALRVRGLRKSFNQPAVKGIDLTIGAGEFYGLLGPNGAGKTTTLRMITGLLRPDAGTIEIFGIDALANPAAAKRLVALLPDEPMLYDKLTPLEYLEFVAGLW